MRFQVLSGDVARAAARLLRIDGFAFDVELLKAVIDMDVLIKEIPVVWSDRRVQLYVRSGTACALPRT